MRVPLDWTERQFAAMGRPDARELALQVVARYQGTALLTSAFRDPDLMTQEAARVAQWIEALDLPLSQRRQDAPRRPFPGTEAGISRAAGEVIPGELDGERGSSERVNRARAARWPGKFTAMEGFHRCTCVHATSVTRPGSARRGCPPPRR